MQHPTPPAEGDEGRRLRGRKVGVIEEVEEDEEDMQSVAEEEEEEVDDSEVDVDEQEEQEGEETGTSCSRLLSPHFGRSG